MKPIQILEYFKVDFVTKHPSVGKSCIAGVCCPFCGDTNYHVGIFKDSGNFSCWKCGAKGSLFKLIREIKGISWTEDCNFAGITIQEGSVKDNLNKIFEKEKTMEEKHETNFEELLEGSIKVIPGAMPPSVELLIDKFLKERKFNYNILKYHEVRYGIGGYFSQRLVIPIFNPDTKKMVGLVGRDLTGMSKSKYLFTPNFKAGKNLYFTPDWIEDSWYALVEGVFDAWSVENLGLYYIGVAMFGSNLSEAQLNILSEYVDKVLYIPDGDTKESTIHKIMERLAYPLFRRVRYIKLPREHDPNSMDSTELLKLIQEAINV